MIGPAIAPEPTVVISEPIALPRSLAGNVVVTMAMPLAWIIAAPTPWSALKATMKRSVWDAPARTAAAMNITNPAAYTRLRPRMSDMRPTGNRSELVASM